MREVAANKLIPAQIISAIMKAVIAVALAMLLVAWAKISMNGYPVGELSALSTFPMQKSTAMSIPNPRVPLIAMLLTIVQGTTVEALAISSHMWTAPSAPMHCQ